LHRLKMEYTALTWTLTTKTRFGEAIHMMLVDYARLGLA